MRNFQSAALGLLAAASSVAASDVHQLKTDTFKPFVQEHDLVLAEFFAPWCGHCKALAPEYEEAATELKDKDIVLAKVDCTEEADLCKEYGVEGYPTLKVFRGEKNEPYQGQRKAPAIISYMTKQALPPVSAVSDGTFNDFKDSDNVVVVAFHAADDRKTNDTFTELAQSLRNDYLFGATNDEALAKAQGVKMPGVALYKNFDEGQVVFDGKLNEEELTKFVKQGATPLVGEVGPETYANYISAGLPLGYIFSDDPEERRSLGEMLREVAQKHKGAINIATIDAKAFGQHGDNLNLKVGDWPAFAIQNTLNNQKFPFEKTGRGALSLKAIGKFVDDFLAGKLEPSVKSEPIPDKQDGPVTVVVAKSYDDIVLDADKDVLLEFYAPWCGHCKALAPKYDTLAQSFADAADKVVIAKVDATANDVPDEIQGFPTIKLFPAGKDKKPVDYSGDRSVEDLAKFVQENGTHKVAAKLPADDEAADADDGDESTGEKMQHQAAAASEKVKGAAKAAAKAAEEVVEGATGGDDDHDEL